jgi:hypothetical protein
MPRPTLRPALVSYDDATGLASFKLDGRVERMPGLSRVGAESVYELRKRGRRVFLTLCYDTGETPALPARRVSDHGGRIEGWPRGV